ncbi:CMP-N-acetylneuraminate-beta-galactosamide-alpha-2,3-sialyltransferase 1-like [Plectropomus leopardus]|uniref:CMP-N-acetylneuraminate-beta-galactosamide- alpha-2,3-sialyltransferase 1-like n=1 Tax=Plectropomus leopardus TaxID=160734 RepID=UPI001C4B4248|nr:CMP-N-acetylneuraminate-beta-galactosamide-alpha-2,3-sialyltransferase 1-like [Plectropomus leopardus]
MLRKMRKSKILISLMCIAAIGLFSGSSLDFSVFSLGFGKSSVCTCHKCLAEAEPWFRNLIEAAPELFLTKNQTPSEQVFNWWKRLQSRQRNYTIYKNAVEAAFEIVPPIPNVTMFEPRRDRCRSCAVVGNSGNLRGSHYGKLIDFHNIVIRINRGRTKGYEAHVGTKTTYRVMYPESAVQLDNTTHLIMFPFKTFDFQWLYKKLGPWENSAVKPRRIANKDLVIILNPAFMKYVHEMWSEKKGAYPSTGFLTVILSLVLCDEVSVFGFGADSDGNWNHYFETFRNKHFKTGGHPGAFEYKLIEQLHDKKILTFFKGF